MSDQAPKHYLVSFKDVSASISGVDISSIVELRLQAAANTVPQVTLLVDVPGTIDGVGTKAVAPVSLDNAREMFDICRSMVRKDGATLSLSLTCQLDRPGGTTDGGAPETQSLKLDGWLLTDVALSPIQRQGVCTAALTFSHPLCKAHFGGAVPGLVAVPPVLGEVWGGNPLDVFVNTLRIYASARRFRPLPAAIPGASSPAEMREQLLARLEKATSDLEDAVEWTHGGLPAFGYLAGWGDLLCHGLARYAQPSGGNSVLQAMLGGLVPECSLALGGDYTKAKLQLGPFEPWGSASLTVPDSDIVSLDLPQADPSPISGVQMLMSATSSDLGVSYHPIGCQAYKGADPAETYYVPESELSSEYLYGPIQQFEEPGWMVDMAYYELAKFSGKVSDVQGAVGGGLRTATTTPRGGGASFGSGGGGSGKSSIDYSQAMLACAKAYYETSLMKDWSFTIGARLMFSTSGGVICPGKVIGVTAGGGEVLGGYITAVEHVISVPSRAATTRIMCTHPRFGALPAAITSPTNALYA